MTEGHGNVSIVPLDRLVMILTMAVFTHHYVTLAQLLVQSSTAINAQNALMDSQMRQKIDVKQLKIAVV